MPLTRTHFRNKSRSPAPNAVEFISASRTPVFLPPAHYAAAAGLDYEAISRARAEGSSPRLMQDPGQSTAYMGSNIAPPLSYPTQNGRDDAASGVNSTSGLNRVSRFIARSPSLGKASAARRASKAADKAPETTKRTSCMADLPFVELQLIPTLRDTIDKMTHPPTPVATHEEEFDGAIENAKVRTLHDAESIHSSGGSQISSCSSAMTSSTRPSTTRTDSLHQYPLLQPPNAIRSALRSPSPAKGSSNDPAPTSGPSSLRKSRLPAHRDVPSAGIPASVSKAADHALPGPSRIPGVPNTRSRFTKDPLSTNSPAPHNQLPVARPQTRAGFGFNFKPSTPQPPPALRPGFPAFKTPQLAQGTFAQRYQTTAPQRQERGSREEPEDAMRRSHLPRPARRSESEHERDSGSELERRVNPGLGRLVVANAQIVPSSSEESAQEERGRPPRMWAREARQGTSSSAFQALGRRTATRVSSPQRRPNVRPQYQSRPQLQQARRRGEATADAQVEAPARRDSRASIGLGFDMDPRMEMGGRYHAGGAHSDADESVYDDDEELEDDAYSDGGDAKHRNTQRVSHDDDQGERRASTTNSPSKRRSTVLQDPDTSFDRRKRLSSIVDGLQATYGAHRSPGKSILSQSESDVCYSQGVAIGTSSDIPNSTTGDVSLRNHQRDEQGIAGDDEDGDEEQSNYSETEDSFSIVVDEEGDQVQPGSAWWTRGRRSPTALGGTAEGNRESEAEVTALRRLSGTSSQKTPQVERWVGRDNTTDTRSRAVSTPHQPANVSAGTTQRRSSASTYANPSVPSPRSSNDASSKASAGDPRGRRRETMFLAGKQSETAKKAASPRSPRHSSQEAEDSRRMTMSFTERFARQPAGSRRSSILEEDTDRTPRVSGQGNVFFASSVHDTDEAVADDDCADREREAYGIPRSLSFGAGHSASDSESSGGPASGRPSALLRSESDESLLGGPTSMTRESSYMANVWRESRTAKDLLSKGAHELFAGLVVQSRGEPERHEDRRERPSSRQDRRRAGSTQHREPVQPREDHRPSKTQDKEAESKSKAMRRQSRHREARRDFPVSHVPDNQDPKTLQSRSPELEGEQQHQADGAWTGQSAPVKGGWQSTLHPQLYEELLSRHGPQEMQRQEVIHELLQTERDFVHHLRAITSAFVLPLRVNASKSWLPGVPTPISRLFDWLEDILNLHTSLLHTVKHAARVWQTGAVVVDVGKDLLPLVPRFEVHQPYLVRVDQVRELVALWVEDRDSQFGEYIRMREEEGVCEGWSLEKCLQSPVQRLGSYLSIFTRLLESTNRQHPDYLATLSLLRSVHMSARVMEEVRVREEEYDFVKDVATHILGPEGAAQLASRERRLLYQGALHPLLPVVSRATVKNESRRTMPTVQINGLPVHDSADEKQGRAERGRRLASAIHDWHVRRARSGSVSSSASSSLSLWSHDSLASNVTPNTPISDVHTPLPDVAHEAIQAFVFTDIVLLIEPMQHEKGRHSEWRLLGDVGLSRILDIRINKADEIWDRTLVLDLIPLNVQELSLSLHSRAGIIVELPLQLPSQDGDSERDWLIALQRSRETTLHSLSFPPPSPEDVLQGPVGDYEQDAYHCVKSILASGLPMPKSPSMQFDECSLQNQPKPDITELEREERGWWSLRFHQVLREFQRQHLGGDAPSAVQA